MCFVRSKNRFYPVQNGGRGIEHRNHEQIETLKGKVQMHVLWKTVLGFSFCLLICPVFAEDSANSGKMMLHGGSSGDVYFDHGHHQTVLKDCTLCHQVFPQETGSIQNMIKSGSLKPKQVMNTQCIACHREKQNAGVATGPVTCTRCHRKGKGV